MSRQWSPPRDAGLHATVQDGLQHFIRWSIDPSESPTGNAPSPKLIQDTARVAADVDPNEVTR